MLKRFKYAFEGIWYGLLFEQNVRIHFLILVLTILGGWLFQISWMEWIVQFLLFGMVIGAELMNTAIEQLTDGVYPEKHSRAKIVKDVAAGSVLFTACMAFVIGLMIYVPKMINYVY